ncbi:MAG TPA: hypothetical protein O0W88_00495, partial [Methanocorpusculum sp.]|nr:hypothetical protein [Methanocorpusculum sp.]
MMVHNTFMHIRCKIDLNFYIFLLNLKKIISFAGILFIGVNLIFILYSGALILFDMCVPFVDACLNDG